MSKPRVALIGLGLMGAWWRTTPHLAPSGRESRGPWPAASLAEAVALIERSGLDRAQALDVITNGAPGSPLVKTLAGRMTARDYTPHFLLKLMAKDLTYALGEGRRHGLSLSTAAAALEVYKQAMAGGRGEEDFSVIVEALRGAAPDPTRRAPTRRAP
jgi:hypothetical protein